jgi:hypothetical protein
LNGKVLNGTLLSELIESYVNQINNGACPNIEDAWTIMTRLENERAI